MGRCLPVLIRVTCPFRESRPGCNMVFSLPLRQTTRRSFCVCVTMRRVAREMISLSMTLHFAHAVQKLQQTYKTIRLIPLMYAKAIRTLTLFLEMHLHNINRPSTSGS